MRLWILALWGCGGGRTDCGVAECAAVCEKGEPSAATAGGSEVPTAAGKGGLTAFEDKIVGPMLQDLRDGIRPFGPDAIGICKGSGRDCNEFLGLAPTEELRAGEYMVRADLRVPKAGDRGTWKVRFDMECTSTQVGKEAVPGAVITKTKEYTVAYAGEDRGYRLQPLWSIKSPDNSGRKDCKYTITAPHPDGEPTVWTGSWIVPEGK